jgi:hypothetical protein
MKQIAADQHKIDLFSDGVSNDAAKHSEKVFVALIVISAAAVCFAKVDVGGVNKAHMRFLNKTGELSGIRAMRAKSCHHFYHGHL